MLTHRIDAEPENGVEALHSVFGWNLTLEIVGLLHSEGRKESIDLPFHILAMESAGANLQ
jgi:hypothetical protein